MTTIASLDARLLRVPLTRPWAADVTSVGVIATHVVRSDGSPGQYGAHPEHKRYLIDLETSAVPASTA